MTIAPPPERDVPLVELLEEVARRLGYDEGAATLSFEFSNGHLSRFKTQRVTGSKWLSEQLGESSEQERGKR